MECGWLTDKFGLSWQIVPTILPEMLQDKDPEKSGRVMVCAIGNTSMLTTRKLILDMIEKLHAPAL